ncbi:ABC transporter ATP-binding protein [Mycoplasma elephantis]|uniref:ABC transporter ATP-binding protein n=1 Tax=Mycoplasma elephantis TaxID=114882 RepID=UPI0004800DFB|nr:ABC transporter ATP-binding protein [Mycoplasma elephantis]
MLFKDKKFEQEQELDDFNFENIDLDKMLKEIGEIRNTDKGANIELKGISKKYEGNEHYTLENIDLNIESGKFCIFLGPSGCGKTTLLRMIAGLNSITKGDLLFNGKRYNNLLPSERNIAMVFQSYALYPHMNVYNNIAFGLKIAKERKDVIDRRVKDVAKILKIENYLYRKPRDLSGGQRQRVAIGRAIARKPQVFLMDEPLSNLDAKLRESMRREIVHIHRMLGATSIYVTHDQLEAMTMGDQIVVFNDGNIQQNGTGRELYFKPANVFVAKFIGSPTMNTFDATCQDSVIKSEFGDINIRLSEELANNLKNKKLIVGFRSEDIYIKSSKTNKSTPGAIKNIELIGKEQLVTVKLMKDDIEFIVTASNSETYSLYSKVNIEFNEERIHIFDFETGKRIN